MWKCMLRALVEKEKKRDDYLKKSVYLTINDTEI